MPAMASGAKSKTPQRFPAEIVATLREGKGLRIRAGTGDHRFIGIWVVVVKDRVFVRSWSVKPDGWYQTFLAEPHGAIRVGDRDIPVAAARTRANRLHDPTDPPHPAKYNPPR